MTTKQRELNLEYWGRVHDMCDAYNKQHGTNIKPQQCVKLNGNLWNLDEHPVLTEEPSSYSLAVAIIEDMPVFVGDKIYYKLDGSMHTVGNNMPVIVAYNWTLKAPKPKRTFELNGNQLPCPSYESNNYRIYLLGEYFCCFDSIDDRNKVAKALMNLLDDARYKD